MTGAERRSTTIEPTHEALLRQWGLLGGWLAEDFALLATLEGCQRAARDWGANARAEAWLAHQGQRLAETQALESRPDIAARLDAIDLAYLAGCRARHEAAREESERQRHARETAQARELASAQKLVAANRRIARRTGAGLVVAVAFATFAAWQWKVARDQSALADKAYGDVIETAISYPADAYAAGGVTAIAKTIDDRSGSPGLDIYLLTSPAGEILLGNVELVDMADLASNGSETNASVLCQRENSLAASSACQSDPAGGRFSPRCGVCDRSFEMKDGKSVCVRFRVVLEIE